jgi:Protein of unknown function (DUF1656)
MGEVSIGGVYLPALVFLGLIALVVFGFLSTLLSITGAYRMVAYRPLADLALLVLVLGALVLISADWGPLKL